MQFLATIINFIFDAYIFILLVRIILQKLHANWHNPVTQFVVKLTDPVIKPARKIIPGYKGLDISIVLIAFIVEFVELYLVTLIRVGFSPHLSGIAFFALISLLSKTIYIFLFATIIWSFLSWFTTSHRHPMSEITGIIVSPLLRLTRRFLPLIGGIDLSPMVIMFVLYLVLRFAVTPLLGMGVAWALG